MGTDEKLHYSTCLHLLWTRKTLEDHGVTAATEPGPTVEKPRADHAKDLIDIRITFWNSDRNEGCCKTIKTGFFEGSIRVKANSRHIPKESGVIISRKSTTAMMGTRIRRLIPKVEP